MNALALNDFDNVTAAGILARAAISLNDSRNPAAASKIPNELDLRRQLIAQISRSFGLDAESLSEVDKEKIEEELDKQSDSLLDPVDESKVLKDLSAKGELPTDLYEISIDTDAIFIPPRKLSDEMKLIRFVVHSPDKVQHLLNEDDPVENPPISLFAKSFENRFSNRNFTMLVTGLRIGLVIKVQQCWRIYADSIPQPSETLLDLLRRFVEEFGIDIEIDGYRNKFFLNANINVHDISRKIAENFTGTRFCLVKLEKIDKRTKKSMASLLYAIDISRYLKRLNLHGWEDEKLVDWAYPIGSWRKPTESSEQSAQT